MNIVYYITDEVIVKAHNMVFKQKYKLCKQTCLYKYIPVEDLYLKCIFTFAGDWIHK